MIAMNNKYWNGSKFSYADGFSEYTRRCKRCKKLFRTPCKYGKICEDCRKPRNPYQKIS